MKIDATLMAADLDTIGPRARQIETLGYDGLYTAETQHDPFFPLVLAAEHTERLDLATAIAVAFPRSPTHLAHLGHDLQRFSKGRFILGLGSQIKAHVEKRFSASFSQPAVRMRELILATRAVWRTWEEDEPLRFEGDFYRLSLMTPFFNPGPTGFGPPKVFLAAVGEKMTEVAGEVCDGMFVHGFTTEKYIRETTLPAIERGLALSGRRRADIELSFPTFMVTGETDEEWQTADAAVREQIAFYGSTPSYRGVLETHGWGEVQDELNALSKRGAWKEMGKVITDDILDAFAVRGSSADLPGLVMARYGDIVDRISFYAPYRTDPEKWADVVAGFKKL
ncbi:MAG TPA: TIGR03617 family F420-dependent LLM class oxidoreductase [Acidimicrobiia bacterium]|nr:TIGR03617 family F420-dependent LLM class oxidoreductase [Acidimicrobiia bacterium]